MVSINAKRKKTADMPDSPPKRVTRARAAKITDDEPQKLKTTTIVTASIQAAAQKKRAGAPVKVAAASKVTKRKTRADDVVAEVVKEPVAQEPEAEDKQQLPEPAKTKGRAKKATTTQSEKTEAAEMPKTRTRQPKDSNAASVNSEPPKARGRPKKVVEPVTETSVAEAPPTSSLPVPVKKTTRGRPTSATSKASTKPAVPKTLTATTKKRVQFEEPDKENIPVETAEPKKPLKKTAGLKAKPVRMPAAARFAPTRGRRGVANTKQQADEPEALPLSPKKVTQVAKSDPISEDELAGEKTPIRALSQSPTKRPMSPVKDIGTVSKLDFGQSGTPSSPAKSTSTNIFSSPARRPPPSPFKDGLKASPVKLNLSANSTQPILLPSRTPMKSSLLQESPKRGIPASSVIKPVLLAKNSPTKTSLLQSPARRPASSPTKFAVRKSPEKIASIPMANSTMDLPTRLSPQKGPRYSLDDFASSPFRAARPAENSLKVHTITDEERQSINIKDMDSTSYFTSKENLGEILDAADVTQDLDAMVDDSMISDDPLSMEQTEAVRGVEGLEESTETQTQNPTAVFAAPIFAIASSSLRRTSMESEVSEDELASPEKKYGMTPLRRYGISSNDFGTPAVIDSQNTLQPSNASWSFTPLADQLSSWNASSPDKQTNKSRQARGMFSLGGAGMLAAPIEVLAELQTESPAKSSFFDDEMVMRDDEIDPLHEDSIVDTAADIIALQISQESIGSDEYGDENAIPSDPELLRVEQDGDRTLTCTPARVFTPMKVIRRPMEMHTVSKVPLRASDEDSPLVAPRQRSKSFGGPLAVVDQPTTQENMDMQAIQPTTPALAATFGHMTPNIGMRPDAETPGRTVRKGVVPDVLKGAIVYVDVHTTEGADASGIFVDLLTQMGARCVKQWNWNPRASMGNSLDGDASPQGIPQDPSASKVGITHVVYKDGGKRTLEKVRSSNGVVLCVGVGWVLDCEREDQWLEEADYAIDTSLVPRGGGRRRKSMEPRALANLNGNLVPACTVETPAKAMDMSPTKEFLTFNTPESRRQTFEIDRTPTEDANDLPAPSTPGAGSVDDNMLEDGSAWGSPTTPYYLSKGAQLVQQTCPSKQMQPMGFFPVSGNVEDQPDESVRRKLLEARRKSLQWSSRIRSPLGRTVSYGK